MLDVKLLETSFLILQDLLEDSASQSEGYLLKFSYQSKYIFAYIVSGDPSFQKGIDKAMVGLKLSRFQLIQSFMKIEDTFYLGLIFHSERFEERKRFCDVARKSLELWENKIENPSS